MRIWQRPGINAIKYYTWHMTPHGKVTKTQHHIQARGLPLPSMDDHKAAIKGIYLSKALTCMKIFLYKQELLFCQGDGYFWPQCCMNNLYTHIDHFTPQHTAFEQSAACLSVFLELLPGLIPLTMLWHAGWTLEKTICMNMTYNYSNTIFRSILTQTLCISCIIYNFSIWPWKIHKQNLNFFIFLPEICTFWAKILLHIVFE